MDCKSAFALVVALAVVLPACTFKEGEQVEHYFGEHTGRLSFYLKASDELAFHYAQGGVEQVKDVLAQSVYEDQAVKDFLTGFWVNHVSFDWALDQVLNGPGDRCLIWLDLGIATATWTFVTPSQTVYCQVGESSL